jgi:hypothetical protein
MKKKLKTADLNSLEFEDADGKFIPFLDLYDYIEDLGFGGFGFVISGIHKTLQVKTAIKVIYDSSLIRFVRKG